MITYATGDILTCSAEALVNTVNCVGVMGRGIAFQFKNAFPKNFRFYESACARHEVRPGQMLVYETGMLTNPKYIINFPTKRHWRGKSRMEDIEAGLQALVEEIEKRRIRSVAVPPLGSGLGGLAWSDVRPRIQRVLGELQDVDVIIYEPSGTTILTAKTSSREVPKMTPGRAALVVLMQRYLAGLLDPMMTLLEVHKLLYFMQEAGQPLRLKYAKAPYGPYAENLRHVLHAVEGHYVSGYLDGGDAPDKIVELVPGAFDEASRFLRDDVGTTHNVERVAELVEGFESPFGLELLATVHWVMTREGASSIEAVTDHVYGWNQGKRRFSSRQLTLAMDTIRTSGWNTPSLPSP